MTYFATTHTHNSTFTCRVCEVAQSEPLKLESIKEERREEKAEGRKRLNSIHNFTLQDCWLAWSIARSLAALICSKLLKYEKVGIEIYSLRASLFVSDWLDMQPIQKLTREFQTGTNTSGCQKLTILHAFFERVENWTLPAIKQQGFLQVINMICESRPLLAWSSKNRLSRGWAVRFGEEKHLRYIYIEVTHNDSKWNSCFERAPFEVTSSCAHLLKLYYWAFYKKLNLAHCLSL